MPVIIRLTRLLTRQRVNSNSSRATDKVCIKKKMGDFCVCFRSTVCCLKMSGKSYFERDYSFLFLVSLRDKLFGIGSAESNVVGTWFTGMPHTCYKSCKVHTLNKHKSTRAPSHFSTMASGSFIMQPMPRKELNFQDLGQLSLSLWAGASLCENFILQ